jgi:hypothetical protein
MLENLLDKKDQTKGSVIRLRQTLAAKAVSPDHKVLADMSNEVWKETVQNFKERRMRLVVGEAIETLIFSEEKAFKAMYGDHIIPICGYATIKIVDSGISSEIIKESREVTAMLMKLTQKYTFEYCKEK